jgi:hypothetical protein
LQGQYGRGKLELEELEKQIKEKEKESKNTDALDDLEK